METGYSRYRDADGKGRKKAKINKGSICELLAGPVMMVTPWG